MEGSHDIIIAPAEWQMVQLEMERRQCNAKFKGGSKCTTPHLYEQRIQDLFLEALGKLMENREVILDDCRAVMDVLGDCSAMEVTAGLI